ncbi:MAG: OmpA family protein [Flavobacteriaceae bacterium]|nr:OmpA family protein [Flavobacteriaceae bacterium]
MKPYFFSVIISLFFVFQINAQNSSLDTWTIGVGASSSIMHGDLTSLNSIDNNLINLGYYVYLSKMISPAFGFELKGQALKMRGSSQNIFENTNTTNGLYFEGNTFGGELNVVINLNGLSKNPYAGANRKWNFSAYLGMGFHTYNSKRFDFETNELLQDFENVFGKDGEANSIYYTSGLGLRYKLSKRLDIELRQTLNFNNEDHLDATISQKQNFETFFTTNLGLVFKLNKKDSESIVWQDTVEKVVEEVVEEEKPDFKDTDGDGVIDQLDKDPNTPKGAITYSNGIAVDTDKDGVIDFYDKCPLVFGLKELEGCPSEKDTDGDGVKDTIDLCPDIVGPIENRGCPVSTNTITEIEKTTIINLAKNIYFPSGKANLIDSSKKELDKIASIMMNYENISFIIEGHTDSGGKRDYNLKLSQDRADTVKQYLINFGVNSGTLTAIGYGFSVPKYNNFTSDGRQLNRRVEIKVKENSETNKHTKTDKVSEITYTIVSQDTLFLIAKKHNVTIDQLREWNNLTDNIIIVGEKLIIKK